MSHITVLVDRGYDRGKHRFCAVMPLGVAEKGEMIRTDRGDFEVAHVGRTYLKDGAEVCNYYLDITSPEMVGAPVAHLTPEQRAYREQRRLARLEGFARYLATTTPEERRERMLAGQAAYKARTTPEERASARRRGVAEYWRILQADPATLTAVELERRRKAEARRKPRTDEQRARIAAGTKAALKRKREALATVLQDIVPHSGRFLAFHGAEQTAFATRAEAEAHLVQLESKCGGNVTRRYAQTRIAGA